MVLRSVASSFPPHCFTQSEFREALLRAGATARLAHRSRDLLDRVLLGDSGIRTRHFAQGDLEAVMRFDAEALHRQFEVWAPRLAADSLRAACEKAAVRPGEIDGLFVCSCTGYLCPGISSYVAEALGMRADAYLQDLLGLGCGAALPMLESARGHLALHPGATVATVAVEVCSSAFFLDDDPGVLVSLCLFGDGASAAIWGGEGHPGGYRMTRFDTEHRPGQREKIRFVNSGGKLKNQLDRSVPALASEAVASLYRRRTVEPERVLPHTGGRDVLDRMSREIGREFPEAREVLRDYGNISSPCVMVALEKALDAGCRGPLWLTAFGAGFAAHCCELQRQEA